MEIFGIGPLELLLVLVISLLVFGPEKLPEVARNIGSLIGAIRRNADDLRESVEQQMGLEDGKAIVEEINKATNEVTDSVKRDLLPTDDLPREEKEKDQSTG